MRLSQYIKPDQIGKMAQEIVLNMSLVWGILSIIFGLLILAAPKLLNYLVGIYLIVIGALNVFANFVH